MLYFKYKGFENTVSKVSPIGQNGKSARSCQPRQTGLESLLFVLTTEFLRFSEPWFFGL